MARACRDSVNFGLKLDLIKAMLEAILFFVDIKDAKLDGRHLDCQIRGFLSILPRQGLGSRQKDSKVDGAICSFLFYLMGWSSARGSKPYRVMLVNVISWSRKLRNTSLLEWALEQLGDMDQNVTLQSSWNDDLAANPPLYNSLVFSAETVKTAGNAWPGVSEKLKLEGFRRCHKENRSGTILQFAIRLIRVEREHWSTHSQTGKIHFSIKANQPTGVRHVCRSP